MKNKKKHPLTIGLVLLGVIGQTMFTSTASASQVGQEDQIYGSYEANRAETERKHIAMVETQELDTVLDVPLRIGGFVTTLVGTGFFIATSPFTGLMTALYPHNAIEKAANYLIVRPGNYTFVRASGSINDDARSNEEK
ncbi:MAG TPA: hypothetical protein VIF10_06500 [Methylobacter sp.]|jgi:hypothetical protein